MIPIKIVNNLKCLCISLTVYVSRNKIIIELRYRIIIIKLYTILYLRKNVKQQNLNTHFVNCTLKSTSQIDLHRIVSYIMSNAIRYSKWGNLNQLRI